jgi:hypothetical protein
VEGSCEHGDETLCSIKCREVNTGLVSLHSVDAGELASVSEIRAVSIFRVKVSRISFYVYIWSCFEKQRSVKAGVLVLRLDK